MSMAVRQGESGNPATGHGQRFTPARSLHVEDPDSSRYAYVCQRVVLSIASKHLAAGSPADGFADLPRRQPLLSPPLPGEIADYEQYLGTILPMMLLRELLH